MELGGDKQLANLAAVLSEQHKFRELIEVETERLQSSPNDPDVLRSRSAARIQAGLVREGLEDLRAAADTGNADAENTLGIYYAQGIPDVLEADPAMAVSWFRKSSW